MQVIQQFEEFESAFIELNKLLNACDTPYTFPHCNTVKEFVGQYAEVQFSRSISSNFSYIDFHLEVNERAVKFDYVSTSGTTVWASFDTLIWDEDSTKYEVGVEIPDHRCTKTGYHYGTITKLLFDDWEGWLNHETGRVVKPEGAENYPTPEWVLSMRSNYILWNGENAKLNALFEKLGFRAENQAFFPMMWENAEGYKVIQNDKSGYRTTFTVLDPDDSFAQGWQRNNLLSVLRWIKKASLKPYTQEFEDYEDYEDADAEDYDLDFNDFE